MGVAGLTDDYAKAVLMGYETRTFPPAALEDYRDPAVRMRKNLSSYRFSGCRSSPVKVEPGGEVRRTRKHAQVLIGQVSVGVRGQDRRQGLQEPTTFRIPNPDEGFAALQKGHASLLRNRRLASRRRP